MNGIIKKARGEKSIDLDFYKKVGQSIRYYRYANSLKQEEVAEKIGISFQQLQKYETGVNRIPVDILIELASLFKITINDLIEVIEQSDDASLSDDDEFLTSLEESYLLSRYVFYKRGISDVTVDSVCQKLKITHSAYEGYEAGKLGLNADQILKVLKILKISFFEIANQDKNTKKLSLDSEKLQSGVKSFREFAQSTSENISADSKMLYIENSGLKEQVQKIHALEKENAELKFQNNIIKQQLEALKKNLEISNSNKDILKASNGGFAIS